MFRDGTGTKTDQTRTHHPAPIYTYTSPPPTHPPTYHTSFTAIPTSANSQNTSTSLPYQCVHLFYRKLKECRGVHRKFERGLHPGCLQLMQVHLGHGVPPPLLRVEPRGIYGTPKYQKPLFSAVYISLFNVLSCTIRQKFMIYTDSAAHIKQLTSYIQLHTLVALRPSVHFL